jgi:hypothetical protein
MEATYENSVEMNMLLGLNALGSVKFCFMLTLGGPVAQYYAFGI